MERATVLLKNSFLVRELQKSICFLAKPCQFLGNIRALARTNPLLTASENTSLYILGARVCFCLHHGISSSPLEPAVSAKDE